MKDNVDRAVESAATVAVAGYATPATAAAAQPVIHRAARWWPLPLVLGLALIGVLIVGVLFIFTVVLAATGSAATEPRSVGCVGPVDTGSLDGTQEESAATIIDVGLSLGVPPRGLVVAIATALQESGLRNLDYGDRDSQGLFQQRPVSGWGTIAQITDPVLASQAFYGRAAHTGNPGLLDIEGWEEMAITDAAQAVQRSAFPLAYAAHEPLATSVVSAYLDDPDVLAGCGPTVTGDWVWPTEGRDTSQFGQCGSAWAACHTGSDVANAVGTPIWAAASGTIRIRSGGPYGLNAEIDHGGGVTTLYAHLDSVAVEDGSTVEVGTVIGGMGWSGNVRPRSPAGSHLHYEVKVDGKPVDPKAWHAKHSAEGIPT